MSCLPAVVSAKRYVRTASWLCLPALLAFVREQNIRTKCQEKKNLTPILHIKPSKNQTNCLIVKHILFKLDSNKIKLSKTILVSLTTVPTITNSGLVEIKP